MSAALENRFYEIVLMIHPDQSDQVAQMLERYKALITEQGGSVDRVEDWGRRNLAYPIKKIHKAHYVLLNLQCAQATLDELTNLFRFNDAVIRHLVLVEEEAITGPSAFLKYREYSDQYRDRDSGRSHTASEESVETTAS